MGLGLRRRGNVAKRVFEIRCGRYCKAAAIYRFAECTDVELAEAKIRLDYAQALEPGLDIVFTLDNTDSALLSLQTAQSGEP